MTFDIVLMPIMRGKFGLITLFIMGGDTFYLRIVYYRQHLILIGLKHILPLDNRFWQTKIQFVCQNYSDRLWLLPFAGHIYCTTVRTLSVQYLLIINLNLFNSFLYNHWVKFLP